MNNKKIILFIFVFMIINLFSCCNIIGSVNIDNNRIESIYMDSNTNNNFYYNVFSNEIPNFKEGTTWYVDDDGGVDFSSIQEAINVSNDGDTIFVYEGNYYENLEIDKSIQLIGENKYNTVIHDSELFSFGVIYISEDWINIDGFTINGGNGLTMLVGSYITISNNIFHNCYSAIDLGLLCNNIIIKENTIMNNRVGIQILSNIDVDEIQIINNTIYNNTLFGINIKDCSNIKIIKNDIYNNSNGIWFENNANNNKILNNNIYNNNRQALLLYNSSSNEIKNNYLIQNGIYGITLIERSEENLIFDNTILRNENIGILLSQSDDNYIEYNKVFLNNNYNIKISNSEGNIIKENKINDSKSGIFLDWNSKRNRIIENQCFNNSIDGIGIFEGSEFNIINSNDCYHNMKGISIRNSDNNQAQYNTCNSNHQGILLNNANRSAINNNVINKNGVGIYLFNSDNVNIQKNKINLNTHKGITIKQNSILNSIYENQIGPWNYQGIYIEKSFFNYIFNNNITKNNDDGIGLTLTAFNRINNNNIIENTKQAIEGTLCFDNAKSNYWGKDRPKRGLFINIENADIYTPGGFVAIHPYLIEPVDIAS